MPDSEVYRYFWIKVTDEQARAASDKAALTLQRSLLEQSKSAAPGSDEERFVRSQQAMARQYLGGELVNGTRIVIWSGNGMPLSVDVLPTSHQEGEAGPMEVAIAAMPADYLQDRSRDWIKTPVGQAWAAGAPMCRLSYAVVAAGAA